MIEEERDAGLCQMGEEIPKMMSLKAERLHLKEAQVKCLGLIIKVL